jgi:hypothetical protein
MFLVLLQSLLHRVATNLDNGEYKFLNFIQVDNVCNSGAALSAAIERFLSPAPVSNCLSTNKQLRVGEYLESNNGLYRARVDTDGRLCVYDETSQVWCTGDSTQYPNGAAPPASGGPGILKMQTDGNLVLYTPTATPYWDSNSIGSEAYLVMQNDRNLVVYTGTSPIWACSDNRDNQCLYSPCQNCGDDTCTVSPTGPPSIGPSSVPSAVPTGAPTESCLAGGQGQPCTTGQTNCCSGSCTGGQKSQRVCTGPAPTFVPTSTPPGPTPTPASCIPSGELCHPTIPCCKGCKGNGKCK